MPFQLSSVSGRALMVVLLLAASFAFAGPLKKDYPLDQITEKVYVIHGPLGTPNPQNQGFMNNPGFVVTDDGVVVVDPGSSVQVGEMVLEKIRTVTDKPVVAVFNTHIHGDHWLGNQAIRAAYPKSRIYAHSRTLERIAEGAGEQWVEMMDTLTEGATKGTRVVGAETAIDGGQGVTIGGSRFEIHHDGTAHTDTDIMIHVVNQDLLFLGDNVGYHRILRMDDGNFAGNIAAIDAALALEPKHYVPGHGPSGGAEVPTAYREYLVTLNTQVKKYYDEGLSDFEIKPLVLPQMAQWESWAGFEDELGKHISLDYLEIESADF